MKKSGLLLLTMLMLTATQANAREWKAATVISSSETIISGPLLRHSTILHYIVETEDLILNLDYSFQPSGKEPTPGQHDKNSPPGLAINTVTKISIGSRHAYILDNTGSEVKMHIVKKIKKHAS